MDKEELVDARGGWTPGKLEYKPLFEFPPKPIALLKWLFNYPDGFLYFLGQQFILQLLFFVIIF